MEIEQAIDVEREILEHRDPTTPLLPHIHNPRKPVVIFLVVMSLFALSLTITLAAELDISFLLICLNQGTSFDVCFQSPEASKVASSVILYSNIINSLGGMFVVPYLSSKSDIYGRKNILIWSIFTIGASQFLKWYIVFGTEHPLHYYWMLAPVCLSVAGGGMNAFGPLAISYVSDRIHDAGERAKYISFVDGSLFIAIAIGPTLGSQIIARFGIENLFYFSIVGCILVILITLTFVKESLSETMKDVNQYRSRKFIGNFKMLLFNHIDDPSRRMGARVFAVCSILGTEFLLAVLNVMFIYMKTEFGWTAVETGYYVTSISTHRLIAYMIGFPSLYKFLSSRWKVHAKDIDRIDLTLTRIALAFCVVGFMLMSVATTPTKFMVSALIESTASYANPIYRSALVKYAPDGQFGAFLGSVSFVNSFMSLIFPTILLKIYGAVVDTWPGLPFMLVAISFGLLFGATFFVRAKL